MFELCFILLFFCTATSSKSNVTMFQALGERTMSAQG